MLSGAEVFAVARREPAVDEVDLWAPVDPQVPTQPRRLRVIGTGHAVEDGLTHLGTVQTHRGALVFHIFEEAI